MDYPKKITDLLQKLIDDGRQLLAGADAGYITDDNGLRRWSNELSLFCSLASDILRPWEGRLQHIGGIILSSAVEGPLSALETIKYAIDNDLLSSSF